MFDSDLLLPVCSMRRILTLNHLMVGMGLLMIIPDDDLR